MPKLNSTVMYDLPSPGQTTAIFHPMGETMNPLTANEDRFHDDWAKSKCFTLLPGETIEFIHRHCPRCGLDLTQERPDTVGDQADAEQIEGSADSANPASVTGCCAAEYEALLHWMVAPLTEAEKERAQRNEQSWRARQALQQPRASEQEDREARRHEHLVPMVKRKLLEWIGHVRKSSTGE